MKLQVGRCVVRTKLGVLSLTLGVLSFRLEPTLQNFSGKIAQKNLGILSIL